MAKLTETELEDLVLICDDAFWETAVKLVSKHFRSYE